MVVSNVLVQSASPRPSPSTGHSYSRPPSSLTRPPDKYQYVLSVYSVFSARGVAASFGNLMSAFQEQHAGGWPPGGLTSPVQGQPEEPRGPVLTPQPHLREKGPPFPSSFPDPRPACLPSPCSFPCSGLSLPWAVIPASPQPLAHMLRLRRRLAAQLPGETLSQLGEL